MTPAEGSIWEFIRKRFLETRFRRQHPIGSYVVDFIAMEYGLVIEIEGGHHFDTNQKKKDQKRTADLEKYDLYIIRFTNNEIFSNIAGVLEHISQTIDYLKGNNAPCL